MFPFYIIQALLCGLAVWTTLSFLIALVVFAVEGIASKAQRGKLHPAHAIFAVIAWTIFALSILAK